MTKLGKTVISRKWFSREFPVPLQARLPVSTHWLLRGSLEIHMQAGSLRKWPFPLITVRTWWSTPFWAHPKSPVYLSTRLYKHTGQRNKLRLENRLQRCLLALPSLVLLNKQGSLPLAEQDQDQDQDQDQEREAVPRIQPAHTKQTACRRGGNVLPAITSNGMQGLIWDTFTDLLRGKKIKAPLGLPLNVYFHIVLHIPVYKH